MATPLSVETLSGRTLEVPPVPTIGDLRTYVAAELGVEWREGVKLVCDSQLLSDNAVPTAGFSGRTLSAFVTSLSVEDILAKTEVADINGRVNLPANGTVLHFLALEGNLKLIEVLLADERFELFNARDYKRRTALQLAASNGHTSVVKFLLKDERIDVDECLHYAACWGRAETVQAILSEERVADVNFPNASGNTALNEALIHEHTEAARVLIEDKRFTAINDKSASGGTALHIAAQHGDTDTVSLLLAYEDFSEVNAVDQQGRTALHRAASLQDYPETAKAILDSDRFTQSDVKDRFGSTAMHLAVDKGSLKTVVVLLAHRKFTDVYARNKAGATAVELAKQRRYFPIAEAFADVASPDCSVRGRRGSLPEWRRSPLVNSRRFSAPCGSTKVGSDGAALPTLLSQIVDISSTSANTSNVFNSESRAEPAGSARAAIQALRKSSRRQSASADPHDGMHSGSHHSVRGGERCSERHRLSSPGDARRNRRG